MLNNYSGSDHELIQNAEWRMIWMVVVGWCMEFTVGIKWRGYGVEGACG